MYKLFNDKQIFRFTLHLKAFFFVPAGSLAEDPAFMHYLSRKYTWFTVPLAQGPCWETPLALKDMITVMHLNKLTFKHKAGISICLPMTASSNK